MTSDLHLSVIRAWRFVDANGGTTVINDLKAYRRVIERMHGNATDGPWQLPWPPFRSHFWQHHLGSRTYENTPPPTLVSSLLPRRAIIDLGYSHPLSQRRPLGEVFLEPFGLWATATVDLTAGSWATDDDAAKTLSGAFQRKLRLGDRPMGRLINGFELEDLLGQFETLPWGDGIQPVDAGTITLVSGVCAPGANPDAEADKLRTAFLGGANATVHPHTRSAGSSATTSDQVGIVLSDSPRASTRIKCLHHNHALLLGHLQTFGALVRHPVPAEALKFQRGAALQLNHLYRGAPVPSQGIYKSRVAPAWIDKQELNGPINAVNASSLNAAPPI